MGPVDIFIVLIALLLLVYMHVFAAVLCPMFQLSYNGGKRVINVLFIFVDSV